jgi:hypothetical protein
MGTELCNFTVVIDNIRDTLGGSLVSFYRLFIIDRWANDNVALALNLLQYLSALPPV